MNEGETYMCSRCNRPCDTTTLVLRPSDQAELYSWCCGAKVRSVGTAGAPLNPESLATAAEQLSEREGR